MLRPFSSISAGSALNSKTIAVLMFVHVFKNGPESGRSKIKHGSFLKRGLLQIQPIERVGTWKLQIDEIR